MGQLVASVTGGSLGSDFYCSRYFWVLILALLYLAVIMKEELAELEWIAIVLFACCGLFILSDVFQIFFDPRFHSVPNSEEFWRPTIQVETINALSVTMLSYTYQQNVYMLYSSLKNKTKEEFMRVNWYGNIVTGVFYIVFAVASVFMFGQGLDIMILNNIGAARTPSGGAFWEALIVQISFAIVLLCHTPFVFCSGKEALLIVIDEVMRKSISNALWHKLQNNEHF